LYETTPKIRISRTIPPMIAMVQPTVVPFFRGRREA
jgi:hypothetical protein